METEGNQPNGSVDPGGLCTQDVFNIYDDAGNLIATSTFSREDGGTPCYGGGYYLVDLYNPYPSTGVNFMGGGGLAPSSVPTISSTVCTGAAVAAGASAGALIGGGIGGGAGAIVGGAGGTLVAPGVGTIGGGVLGAEGGAGVGATVGGFIGGAIGGIVGNVLCAKGGGPSFGNNQRQNKQADDAKNAAERQTGKQFTPALERMFHDEITGMNYSYQQLVQIAVEILEMHG